MLLGSVYLIAVIPGASNHAFCAHERHASGPVQLITPQRHANCKYEEYPFHLNSL